MLFVVNTNTHLVEVIIIAFKFKFRNKIKKIINVVRFITIYVNNSVCKRKCDIVQVKFAQKSLLMYYSPVDL